MIEIDTFLTTLYVTVDDFCQCHPRKQLRSGPGASLCPSEVLTLAIFARFSRFGSERDFYRYAKRNLQDAFPTLPDRSQFNRLVRSQVELIEEVALHLAALMGAKSRPYQALDRVRLCPSGTPREGARGGWPDRPTSDGAIVWDGTKDSA